MSRRGWVLLILLGAIWGVPYLLIKVAVAEVSPAGVVLARTALGALVLLPFALRGAGFAALRGRWRALAVFAALEVVGPWMLFSDAERTLDSSTTGLLVATVPVLAVVVGRVAGDRLPVAPARWAGLLVGLGGVALLTGPGVSAGHAWPVTEVVLGALGYAIAPVIAERYLQGVPAAVLTTACLGLAALVYGPVVALSGPVTLPGPAAVASLVALGLVCTAVAFLLFFRLIAEVGGPRSTLVAYLNPLVAVSLGAIVLDERLDLTVGLATLLIVGGSAAASLRRAPAPAPKTSTGTSTGASTGTGTSTGIDAGTGIGTGTDAGIGAGAGTDATGATGDAPAPAAVPAAAPGEGAVAPGYPADDAPRAAADEPATRAPGSPTDGDPAADEPAGLTPRRPPG